MKCLAFDTSTEHLSVAAQHGDRVWSQNAEGGAKASAALIPLTLQALAEVGLSLRNLDAIAFGAGPGAFTGLRTACAVAQGLGFGAGVPLIPMDTLMAVAEDARSRHGCTRVLAALDARMHEVYAAAFEWDGAVWRTHPLDGWADGAVGAPERVPPLPVADGWVIAGTAQAYAARLPALPMLDALPSAEAMLRLAPALMSAGHAVPAADALPRYLRDKVAQTTAEREADRALKAARA